MNSKHDANFYDAHYFLGRTPAQNREMVDGWVRRGWAAYPGQRLMKRPDAVTTLPEDPLKLHQVRQWTPQK